MTQTQYTLDGELIGQMIRLPDNFTGINVIENGSKFWRVNGKRHRENGLPAIEFENGDKEYWFEGKPHNLNGHVRQKQYYIHGQHIKCSSDEQFKLYVDLLRIKRLL